MAGILDFLNTPAGTGLLSAVASYAANARKGAPINNIGRGLMGGLAGYQAAQQGIVDEQTAAQEREYRNAMMKAQTMNAETAAENARRKRQDMENSAKSDAKVFERVFSVPIQVQQAGEDFDFTPVGYQSDMMEIKDAKDVKPPPQFQINDNMAKMYGFTPDDLNYISGLYQVDPKAAVREMSSIRAANRKGKTEAKDVLAKERAIAEAMGMPLDKYLLDKTNRSGVQVKVENQISPFQKEADKKQGAEFGPYMVDLRRSADTAYQTADEIGAVTEMLKGYAGGPWDTVKAKIGQYMPADSDWAKLASLDQTANSIRAKLAPQMRAVGSGATSDFEMKMWLDSIPSLMMREDGRRLVAKYSERLAERQAAKADIEVEIYNATGKMPSAKMVRDELKKRFPGFLDPADMAFIRGGKTTAQPQTAKPAAQPAKAGGVKFLGFE